MEIGLVQFILTLYYYKINIISIFSILYIYENQTKLKKIMTFDSEIHYSKLINKIFLIYERVNILTRVSFFTRKKQ